MSTPSSRVPRQPVYRQPRHRGQPESWRVGLNDKTGLGQYPTPGGLSRALGHIHTRQVQVRLWGPPAYPISNSGRGSDTLDAAGAVWNTVVGNTRDLKDAALRPGATTEDIIADELGLDYLRVWQVTLVPLP